MFFLIASKRGDFYLFFTRLENFFVTFLCRFVRISLLRGDMHKIDAQPHLPTFVSDSAPHADGRSARRLIVLLPAESDTGAITHRLWELANTAGIQILLLSLCKDAAQEPSLRRRLITMVSLLQDGKVSAEVKVDVGTNWLLFAKRFYQAGDMIVCFAEQRAGLLHRPLSQILQSDLNAPVYILSGLYPQNLPRSNRLSQILAWTGSLGIIVGSFLLQIKITAIPQGWAQTTLLIGSVIGEVWLIWVWNKLSS
jgi:hypothetical protein